jgi:hypothetical protein
LSRLLNLLRAASLMPADAYILGALLLCVSVKGCA